MSSISTLVLRILRDLNVYWSIRFKRLCPLTWHAHLCFNPNIYCLFDYMVIKPASIKNKTTPINNNNFFTDFIFIYIYIYLYLLVQELKLFSNTSRLECEICSKWFITNRKQLTIRQLGCLIKKYKSYTMETGALKVTKHTGVWRLEKNLTTITRSIIF